MATEPRSPRGQWGAQHEHCGSSGAAVYALSAYVVPGIVMAGDSLCWFRRCQAPVTKGHDNSVAQNIFLSFSPVVVPWECCRLANGPAPAVIRGPGSFHGVSLSSLGGLSSSSVPEKEERKHRGPAHCLRLGPEAAASAFAQEPLQRTQSCGPAPRAGFRPEPRSRETKGRWTAEGPACPAVHTLLCTILQMRTLNLESFSNLICQRLPGRTWEGALCLTPKLVSFSPPHPGTLPPCRGTPSLRWNRVHVGSPVASRSTSPNARLTPPAAVLSWPSIGVDMWCSPDELESDLCSPHLEMATRRQPGCQSPTKTF